MKTHNTHRLLLMALLGILAGGLAGPSTAEAQSGGATTSLLAQPGRLGIGIGGGSLASGLTAKYYLDSRTAVQAALGSWAGWGFLLGADVIFEMPQLYQNPSLGINWEVGLGATLGTYNASYYSGGNGMVAGASGVVGLGMQLTALPLEFVLDLRPTLLFGWGSNFYIGGGGAIRYFF